MTTSSTLVPGPAILTTVIFQTTGGVTMNYPMFNTQEYSNYQSAQEAQRLFNINIAASMSFITNLSAVSWISGK